MYQLAAEAGFDPAALREEVHETQKAEGDDEGDDRSDDAIH